MTLLTSAGSTGMTHTRGGNR